MSFTAAKGEDLVKIVKRASSALGMRPRGRRFETADGREVSSVAELLSLSECHEPVVVTRTAPTTTASAPPQQGDAEKPGSEDEKGDGNDLPDQSCFVNRSPFTVNLLCDSAWLEDEAVKQLNRIASCFDGVEAAVGLPDLHPGRGIPIGAAFAVRGRVFPSLIGGDIGCGMGLWQLDLDAHKTTGKRVERMVGKLTGLEGPWGGDRAGFLRERGVAEAATEAFSDSLGTIGRGNHFAEVQAVEEVLDAEALEALGLDADRLLLLVHSGSRGLGQHILEGHERAYGSCQGLDEGTESFCQYLGLHDTACAWAKANRALIAQRVAVALDVGLSGEPLLDITHNNVVKERGLFIHRKGAAPSNASRAVVIPGSRGAFSYLVVPACDEGSPEALAALHSLAHGAGRKLSRGRAREAMAAKFSRAKLARTELGGHVVCNDNALIFEEAPEAYKPIKPVIDDLVSAKLIKVIATLRPLISYKTN